MAVTHWSARACRFHAENKTDWKQSEARGWEGRLISQPPLNFTYPLHSRSASPHTPASLRDISCAQRGDKTHRLSVGPCIHLVPIAAPWTPYPRKWLFIGRRSLLFLLSGVSSRSKVKGNALTERGKTRDYSGKCKQTLPAASTETFNLQQQKVLHKR